MQPTYEVWQLGWAAALTAAGCNDPAKRLHRLAQLRVAKADSDDIPPRRPSVPLLLFSLRGVFWDWSYVWVFHRHGWASPRATRDGRKWFWYLTAICSRICWTYHAVAVVANVKAARTLRSVHRQHGVGHVAVHVHSTRRTRRSVAGCRGCQPKITYACCSRSGHSKRSRLHYVESFWPMDEQRLSVSWKRSNTTFHRL